MKIVLLHVSSAREDWSDEASAIYVKKISAFLPCADEALKPKKASRDDADFKRKSDTEILMGALKPDDFVMLLDERGKTFDSRAFAKTLEQTLARGKKRLVVVIGGAYGFTDEIRERADLKVSLGPMTMNHLLARVVALEQIYRAFTILRGLPYHND